jgi:predicted aspartyl protease
MGTFKAHVGVNDGNGGDTQWVDALVDTGATYSVLPASMLRQRVGIEPTTRLTFTFATGDQEELPVGEARFCIGDREGVSKVVFGAEGQFLLGATALQELALIADTSRHRLVHAPSLLI